MKVNTIISALPKLTPQELSLVRAAIDALRADQGETAPPLYVAITGLLGSQIPWGVFRAGATYKTYQRGANAVCGYIETHWGGEREVVKQGILRFMLDTLLDDLKARGVPLTINTVSKNLDRLPALFSAQFPDYLEAGMAGIIVKAMRRK